MKETMKETPKETPIQMSKEQIEIYEHLKDGKNIIVDSIAGSGKSTTIITLAQLFPEKHFLQITYNSMLRKEFQEKVASKNISNIEIHTYHSLAVKYFASNAYTDTGLRDILTLQIKPFMQLPQFQVIVLDECQDMTNLYFHFIQYTYNIIITDNHLETHPQLLFLGDYMQCLYEFKGADFRFLTLADKIWSAYNPTMFPPSSFVKCSLKTSYRITNQMARFVNEVMLEEPRMNACREGNPVVYIRNTRSNIERIIVNHIQRILNEGDLPNDIFILAPSVKGATSNIRRLENTLVEYGIPCHVPMFENERITDERVINGKVVFSTFHSVKGRQRKYVFVMNFDNSYFSIYARNVPSSVCPNTLYVATTRATHNLYLLEINQRNTDRPLDFLKMSHPQMKNTEYIDFKGTPQSIFYEDTPESKSSKENKIPIRYVTPTDLIKFIPENIIEEITPILKELFVRCHDALDEFIVPNVVSLKNGLFEDVCDLNGIAIPCIYYDYLYNKTEEEVEKVVVVEKKVEMKKKEVEKVEVEKKAEVEKKERKEKKEKKKKEEDKPLRPNILYKYIESSVKQMKDNEYVYLKQLFHELSPYCNRPDEYLYMANVFVAFQEKLYFKIKQIERDEYGWLSNEIVEKCKERMNTVIREKVVAFEETFINHKEEENHFFIDTLLNEMNVSKKEKYRFTARLDLISENTIWELKFVNEFTNDHFLQCIIYAWLWKCVHVNDPKNYSKRFKLFNIKTNEIHVLNATFEELTHVVSLLLKGKYDVTNVVTDEEFIEKTRFHGWRV